MSPASKRWVVLYLCLLLALSFVAVKSQTYYFRHAERVEQKTTLLLERVDKRAEAARFTNPQHIRAWAELQGMIPVSQAEMVFSVTASHKPDFAQLSPTSMEIHTLWR